MKNSKNGFAPVLLLMIAILVVWGGFYIYSQNKKNNQTPAPVVSNTNNTASTTSHCYLNYDQSALMARIKQDYPNLPRAIPTGVIYNVPSEECLNEDNKLFAAIQKVDAGAAGKGYRIVFSGENGCTAHVCETASMSVYPQTIGGVNLTNEQFRSLEKVTLKGNITGYYRPEDCGASCANPQISFVHADGTLFTFSAPGSKEDLVQWINTALPVI